MAPTLRSKRYMRIAYYTSNDTTMRVHISEYTDIMSGHIFCHEGHPVIAKRGMKNVHHFAHKAHTLCSCHDNKGDWHIHSQDRCIKDGQEIRLQIPTPQGTITHIADLLIPIEKIDSLYTSYLSPWNNTCKGIVCEYQHSPMEESVMRERERFYTSLGYHLVWIFDTSLWEVQTIKRISGNNLDISSPQYRPTEITYRKKRGADFPLLGAYTGKVTKIFDFNKGQLFVVTKQQGISITGYVLSLEDFDRRYLGSYVSSDADMRPFHHPL